MNYKIIAKNTIYKFKDETQILCVDFADVCFGSYSQLNANHWKI